MKRIYGILTTALFFVLLISGCSSDGSSEAESIMNNQVTVTENYVNGLADAKTAEDVIEAIEKYTKDMKKLIPQLQEFQKNHPEYTQEKMTEEMAAGIKRLETASAKIPGAMMKVTQYMMDPKVQAALTQMGEEMDKLN